MSDEGSKKTEENKAGSPKQTGRARARRVEGADRVRKTVFPSTPPPPRPRRPDESTADAASSSPPNRPLPEVPSSAADRAVPGSSTTETSPRTPPPRPPRPSKPLPPIPGTPPKEASSSEPLPSVPSDADDNAASASSAFTKASPSQTRRKESVGIGRRLPPEEAIEESTPPTPASTNDVQARMDKTEAKERTRPKDEAMQLMNNSGALFTALSRADFAVLSKEGNSTNTAFKAHLNNTQKYFLEKICNSASKSEAVNHFKYAIDVASECIKAKDYHTAVAINSALLSYHLNPLKINDELSKDYKDKLDKINTLFEISNRAANYRETIDAEKTGSYIPQGPMLSAKIELVNATPDKVSRNLALDELYNDIVVSYKKTHNNSFSEELNNKLIDASQFDLDSPETKHKIESLAYPVNYQSLNESGNTLSEQIKSFDSFKSKNNSTYKLPANLTIKNSSGTKLTGIEAYSTILENLADKSTEELELGQEQRNNLSSLVASVDKKTQSLLDKQEKHLNYQIKAYGKDIVKFEAQIKETDNEEKINGFKAEKLKSEEQVARFSKELESLNATKEKISDSKSKLSQTISTPSTPKISIRDRISSLKPFKRKRTSSTKDKTPHSAPPRMEHSASNPSPPSSKESSRNNSDSSNMSEKFDSALVSDSPAKSSELEQSAAPEQPSPLPKTEWQAAAPPRHWKTAEVARPYRPDSLLFSNKTSSASANDIQPDNGPMPAQKQDPDTLMQEAHGTDSQKPTEKKQETPEQVDPETKPSSRPK